MSPQISPPVVDGEPVNPGASVGAAPTRRKRSLLEVLRALRQPKVAVMFALGFSSGLPFMLVGNTFNYWLADSKVDLKLVGFASWVGLSYTFKFILGAVVDSVPVPLLARLGRRRAWMIVTQVLVAAGLLGMAANAPGQGLATCVAFAVMAAFGSAMQDTAVDAWRIEIAEDSAELDILTSSYSLAYRIAMILTQSTILILADALGWPISYAIFAAAMVVGLGGTLAAREPLRTDAAPGGRAVRALSLQRIYDVVVGPFIEFFRKFGWAALLMLAVVTTYHLCDYLRGPMINPFYVQIGLPKSLVGTLRFWIGIPSAMVGIACGGLFAARFGRFPALLVGAVLQPVAVAAFALLALTGPDPRAFAAVLAFDDVCMSFAGVVLIAYISTLTSLGYTATQYALLTSALALTGKALKGYSGAWVKALAARGGDLTHAYATYFLYASLVGVPALALVLWLAWIDRGRVRGRATA